MQGNVSRWIGVFRPALAVLGIAGTSWVNTAAASTSSAVSPLAMPIVSMAPNDDAITTCDQPSQSSGYVAASSYGYSYQYAHWRPRRWREPREQPREQRYNEPKNNGFSQIQAGFLDPDGENQGASLLLGYRMGFNVDRNVAIGGQVDWRHEGDQQNTVISTAPGPGGTTIDTETQIAKSSSDLIPLLGMLQINVGDSGVVPYIGAGAGYEILHLASDDFVNGQQFRGTFGGFGWQLWAGLGVPLGSNQTRLTAEAFLNRADVSRDATDALGQAVKETVNMDGTGARFGLQWAF